MRPRVFPAEDEHVLDDRVLHRRASMRPRVFPAEDVSRSTVNRMVKSGFNEAAGIPRGRLPGAGRMIRPSIWLQ